MGRTFLHCAKCGSQVVQQLWLEADIIAGRSWYVEGGKPWHMDVAGNVTPFVCACGGAFAVVTVPEYGEQQRSDPHVRAALESLDREGLGREDLEAVAILKQLGLGPHELRKSFRELETYVSCCDRKSGVLQGSARAARRYVALRRQGISPGQAMHQAQGGAGCLLAVAFVSAMGAAVGVVATRLLSL
ncbi:MAG: hypothetical protein ABR915_08940 [Thermoguttaceae bacterium]|jgi:hypothetical protein